MALGMQFAPMRKFEMNFGKDCVLSLGSRHSVEPRKVRIKTREKVCVWCVFEPLLYSAQPRQGLSQFLSGLRYPNLFLST